MNQIQIFIFFIWIFKFVVKMLTITTSNSFGNFYHMAQHHSFSKGLA